MANLSVKLDDTTPPAFADYLKARVRGQTPERPDAKPLEAHLSHAA